MAQLTDVHLHEQLLLLALSDDKGTMQGQGFEVGAGGAMLAELMLTGRLGVEQVKKKQLVLLVSNESTGDPIMDDVLQRIRTSPRREQVNTWVVRIARTKRLRHRVADRLRYRGILGKAEGRVLWVFTRTLYPTMDPGPERELVANIRAAVFEEGDVDARTAVLLTIAQSLNLLRFLLTKEELKQRKARLKQIGKLEVVSAVAKPALEAVIAVLAAQRAAAVAAATAG